MGKNKKQDKKQNKKDVIKNVEKVIDNFPFVSICTPTFNRRPFIPYIIKCFENQDYPKDKMEWIIIDDGTDKIEDLFINVPQVKYFKYDEKMRLGKKRNIAHEQSIGSIIVYMDDDDYYPHDRVSHAVDMLLKNPHALCAGSSEMHIYFKHIEKLYKFGPYGPNHSTAATFAFRRELLLQTSFDETAAVAEEKHFLKNYTIPFVQLETTKSILVFSHDHNSFDKKSLLETPNDYVKISEKTVDDFIKESDLKKFFMEDVDIIIKEYEPGRIEHKPDVLKQIAELKMKREKMIEDFKKQQQNNGNGNGNGNSEQQRVIVLFQKKLSEMSVAMQEIIMENNLLKDKVKYLENKLKD
jgi:glycosyltransferase involved in cell wall biosynthesis